MKKLTVCACLCASSVIAYAQVPNQNGVQLFGLIDASVERLNHVGGDGTLTRMPNITSSQPSRWGLRGSEDLGGGTRALFVLEAGFSPDTGSPNQGGRAFGRQALVGVADSQWGTLTFGRQYSMYFLAMLDAAILGPNIYGTGSLDTYIPQARFDNAVAWQGKWGSFSAGANYSFGRDVYPAPAGAACAGELSTDAQACRAASAMIKYDPANWGVALAWERQNGGPGATGGLTASQLSDQRTFVTGYTRLDAWKIGAGWVRRDNESLTAVARKSDLVYVEGSYAASAALSFDAQLAKLDYHDSPAQATLIALRSTYQLSKRTAVYITAGRIRNEGPLALSVSAGATGGLPATGQGQTGLAMGVRHAF